MSFVHQVEARFALDPEAFHNDLNRVVFVTGCFSTVMQRRWHNYAHNKYGARALEGPTYEELKG